MKKEMVYRSRQRAGGWCEPAGEWTFPLFELPMKNRKAGTLYRTFERSAILPAIWVATRIPSVPLMNMGLEGFFIFPENRALRNISY